jgi:hypothetical protein
MRGSYLALVSDTLQEVHLLALRRDCLTITPMTTTPAASDWAETIATLKSSTTLTDKLNGGLAQSIQPEFAHTMALRNQRGKLMFVVRPIGIGVQSYVLASFVSNETYEYVLVVDKAVRASDRCSAAIRTEVLRSFLSQILSAARSGEKEAPAPEPVQEVPELAAQISAIDPDGWRLPGT